MTPKQQRALVQLCEEIIEMLREMDWHGHAASYQDRLKRLRLNRLTKASKRK